MDAASGFILSTTPVQATSAELSKPEARRLLESGISHRNELPRRLLVPDSMLARQLSHEAVRQGVAVERVSEAELEGLTGEA